MLGEAGRRNWRVRTLELDLVDHGGEVVEVGLVLVNRKASIAGLSFLEPGLDFRRVAAGKDGEGDADDLAVDGPGVLAERMASGELEEVELLLLGLDLREAAENRVDVGRVRAALAVGLWGGRHSTTPPLAGLLAAADGFRDLLDATLAAVARGLDGGFLGEGGLQRLDSLLGREELELRVLSESLGLGIAELALFEAHVENRGILADDVEKRSEERRVGKECRSRWSAYPEETKEKI